MVVVIRYALRWVKFQISELGYRFFELGGKMRQMLLTLAMLVWGLALASGADVAGQAADLLAIGQQRGGSPASFNSLSVATILNCTPMALARGVCRKFVLYCRQNHVFVAYNEQYRLSL